MWDVLQCKSNDSVVIGKKLGAFSSSRCLVCSVGDVFNES